jgi:hypothetical protein
MKRILLGTLALLLFVYGCASMQPVKEEDKTFSQVFDAPGNSKDKLYDQIKIWIAQTFVSAKAVVEYENKEAGTIVGNGIIKYPCGGLDCIAKGDWKVPFNMKVDVKDDKFKLTFSNLGLSWPAKRDSLGFHEAFNGPLTQQGDYDKARPKLLGFGDAIKEQLAKGITADKW